VNAVYVGVLEVEVVRLQNTQLLYNVVKQHLPHTFHLHNNNNTHLIRPRSEFHTGFEERVPETQRKMHN